MGLERTGCFLHPGVAYTDIMTIIFFVMFCLLRLLIQNMLLRQNLCIFFSL